MHAVLCLAAADEVPNIEFIYSAMDEYDLPDMSATSWQQLTDRSVAAKWARNNSIAFYTSILAITRVGGQRSAVGGRHVWIMIM